MRLKEAASQLRISERSLYRLIQEGLLKHHLVRTPMLVVNVYHLDADYVMQIKKRLSAKKVSRRVNAIRNILIEWEGMPHKNRLKED